MNRVAFFMLNGCYKGVVELDESGRVMLHEPSFLFLVP